MREPRASRSALLVVDGVASALLFSLVSLIRFGDDWRSVWAAVGATWWMWAIAYGILWSGAGWLMELDRPRTRWSLHAELGAIVRAIALVAVTVFSLLFLFHMPQVSRQFVLLLLVAQALSAVLGRSALRAGLVAMRARGVGQRQVLVVGAGPLAQRVADQLAGHRDLGFRVIGHLGEPGFVTRPVAGVLDDISDVMHRRVVDEVVVCLEGDAALLQEAIVTIAQREGKIIRVPVEPGSVQAALGNVQMLDDQPFLTITNSPDRLLGFALKRLLDVVLALVALVVLAPLFVAIVAVIAADGGGRVIFRQSRVGLNGRRFTMIKFRSMIPDAEAMVDGLAEHNAIEGHAFKLDHDPRVTRVGAFLRRTSLDELPQLWNVLLGDMSIVGPRPPLPVEVAGYDVWHRRRLSMKPGITGLWQVSARLEASFDRWVELDLSYIDRWSLWLDVKIMLRTVPAMLSGR